MDEAVFARGIVVIRPYRFCHAPERHRQLGVELARALERARRLIVIERVNLAQSLVEERLRLRVLRRDRVMPVAVAAHQHGGGFGGASAMPGMLLRESGLARRESGDGQRQGERKGDECAPGRDAVIPGATIQGVKTQDAAMHAGASVEVEVG